MDPGLSFLPLTAAASCSSQTFTSLGSAVLFNASKALSLFFTDFPAFGSFSQSRSTDSGLSVRIAGSDCALTKGNKLFPIGIVHMVVKCFTAVGD